MIHRTSGHQFAAAIAIWCMFVTATNAQDTKDWHRDLPSAQRESQAKKLPILIHFYAPWCIPCQKMDKAVLHQPAITKEFGSSIVACKIDGDQYPELISRYGVDTYPTDILLDPSGNEIERSAGDLSLFAYSGLMQRATARFKPTKRASPVLAQAPQDSSKGLDGYCPVTLKKRREWVKGTTDLQATYKQITYHFQSSSAKEAFDKSPETYAPKLLGCDPVVLAETHRAVPGRTQYGAFFDNKLFLFSTSENRKRFKKNPLEFTRVRHVLKVDDILKTAIVPRESSK